VNAEFNVWLLIVGLVVGAGLVWLVVMDSRRRESEVDAIELPREAAWLSAVMREDGDDVSPEAAERLLLLHRAYLDAPPPDAPTWPEDLEDAAEVDIVEDVDEVGPDRVAGSEIPEQDRIGIDSGARSIDQ
jgi:hypothetical protein